MRVVALSVTDAGRQLAARLPYESHHGAAGPTVRRLWTEADAFVLMLATGAATRIVGPLLSDKARDPAVVCVDEAGRWVIPLSGGHAAGANHLAREVAALLGAEAVVTTATDTRGLPALDALPGFVASGDVGGVSRALLDGRQPRVEVRLPGWPAPAALPSGSGPERVVVTDTVLDAEPGVVALHPPSLIAGVGCSSDAGPDTIVELISSALTEAGLDRSSLAGVATIDRRRDHPAVKAVGLPVRTFSAEELAAVSVPNPSAVVAGAVGTPSVAEAAALLAAGAGAELAVDKRASGVATVAIARRARPTGCVVVVGLGPGSAQHRTPAAAAAVRSAQIVIGYGPYVDQAADLVTASQSVERWPIGDEVARARRALEHGAAGHRVAVVCSGDAGVYAMASVVLELAGSLAPHVEVEVVPGVTAALAAASRLGAPLGHDHAVISLSDLLTPWEIIERRLQAVAEADLVVALYNPRSRQRSWQLDAALGILRRCRPADTPVGIVTDAGRPGERIVVSTLDTVDTEAVGMTTCVIVGATSTTMTAGRMVTPRGYGACR